jgi:hypothetical protein
VARLAILALGCYFEARVPREQTYQLVVLFVLLALSTFARFMDEFLLGGTNSVPSSPKFPYSDAPKRNDIQISTPAGDNPGSTFEFPVLTISGFLNGVCL